MSTFFWDTLYYRILLHLDQLNLPLVDPPRVIFSPECLGWDVLWTLSLLKVKTKHILIELKIWGLAQKGNKFSIIQEQQHSTHYFSCNECLSSSTTLGILSSYFNVEQTYVVYLAMYRSCWVHNPYSTAGVIWPLFVFKQQASWKLLRVKIFQIDQNIHPFFIGAIKTSWAIPLSIEHGITQNIDLKELISAFDKIKTWKKIF